MFIDNYLNLYMVDALKESGIVITRDEARRMALGKACMFSFDKVSGDVANVWQDSAMTIPLPNPLQADSNGVFPDYVAGDNVKFLVQDRTGKAIERCYIGETPAYEQADNDIVQVHQADKALVPLLLLDC
jgi:hypothetical protein